MPVHPPQTNALISTGGNFTIPVLDDVVPYACGDDIVDTPWLKHLKTKPLSDHTELGMVGVGGRAREASCGHKFVFMSMCAWCLHVWV